MSSETQQGIVLRATPLRESDLIVSFLTKESGKISAIARGARRSKKRFMGGLDLFDCGLFEYSLPKKPDGLSTLHGISYREPWLGLRENLTKFSLASFCLEVTNLFAHEGDAGSGEIYPMLYQVLRSLHRSEAEEESFLLTIGFAVKFLEISGLDPTINGSEIGEEFQQWWKKTSESNQSISSLDSQELKSAFAALLRYIEKHLGHALRSPQRLQSK